MRLMRDCSMSRWKWLTLLCALIVMLGEARSNEEDGVIGPAAASVLDTVRVMMTSLAGWGMSKATQGSGNASPVSADCAAKRGVAGSDVILLMGQSNMSGRGKDYDADIDGPTNPRIQQWSRANTIIMASEHLEHADFGVVSVTSVGMGAAFGRSLLETLPEDRSVLLVPTAYGGTALVDGPWSAGGHLFEDAVTRMEAALASNETAGNCVAAVLWHQGEADATAGIDQETYRSTWTDMISTLRARIPEAEEAPVILGEFTSEWVEDNAAITAPILSAIRAIPDSVPFTAVASSDGLSGIPGNIIHFDAEAQREYGRRYFDKLSSAIENNHEQFSLRKPSFDNKHSLPVEK